MRRKRVEFNVSFVPPAGATDRDMREYIIDAVATWSGQCRPSGALSEDDPGDPMFGLDSETVRASKIRKK